MNFLFSFQGRIGRLHWWGGQLVILALIVAPFFLLGIGLSGMSEEGIKQAAANNVFAVIGVFFALYALCLWINIAVTVKRYHDRNKSGFWFLIILVPFIGGIWQLVECGFLAGTPGGNNYGQRGSRGGGAFGDYLDDGEPSNPAVEAIRRSREERSTRRPDKPTPATGIVRVSPRTGRPVSPGFGKRGL